MKNKYSGMFLLLGLVIFAGTARAEDLTSLEQEIQSLDPATRAKLANDMIGELQKEDKNLGLVFQPTIKEIQYSSRLSKNELVFKTPAVKPEIREWQFNIQDEEGRTVRTLKGSTKPPKYLTWDRRDQKGKLLSSPEKYRFVFKADKEVIPLEKEFISPPALPLPESAWGKSRILQSLKNFSRQVVKISQQQDNHLLITVGDVIYFPTPEFVKLQAKEQYYIYKGRKNRLSDQGAEPVSWWEQIGKLEVLEVEEKLSIGLVIKARDIIETGDIILMASP